MWRPQRFTTLWASTACYRDIALPFLYSTLRLTFSVKRHGKEELLEASYSTRSVSYQYKMVDYLFPELLVLHLILEFSLLCGSTYSTLRKRTCSKKVNTYDAASLPEMKLISCFLKCIRINRILASYSLIFEGRKGEREKERERERERKKEWICAPLYLAHFVLPALGFPR
jgi:hypothetical protein